MERRGEERRRDMAMGVGFTSTPAPPEIPVKLQLPLAPILPDRRGTPNPLLPTRRGTAIFSPTHIQTQTLDHPYLIINPRATPHLSPLPPPLDDDQDPSSSPDPDPPSTTVDDDASNSIRNNSTSPPPQPPPAASQSAGGASFSPSVKYKECLKNHAASMGSHVVDGCGEFMPSGDDGTPQSLRCAACDCHRNFHRKEIEGGVELHPQGYYPSYSNNPQIGQITYSSGPTHPQQRRNHHKHQTTPTTIVNFAGGSGGGGGGPAEESSSEDLSNMFQSGAVQQQRHRGQSSLSRKRFRTKFSQEQKDRMQEFAARVGWRIQKQDDQEVQQFCTEVGVTRQVFKVWMHNKKQAIKRRQPD